MCAGSTGVALRAAGSVTVALRAAGSTTAALRAASSARSRLSRSRGSSRVVASSSFISAMKRLGSAGTVSRPRLRRLSVLTVSVVRARA